MNKKIYNKPLITIINLQYNSMINCSCTHNCIGTKCNCRCKGWKNIDEEEYDGSMLE